MRCTLLEQELVLPSPLISFTPTWKGAEQVEIKIKRDDLIHPVISGNKWRKLSSLLNEIPQDTKGIVSFGGGFSNHIHALAYCCKGLSLPFTAIIRGDYSQHITPMLEDILAWGAQVVYVDRVTFKRRNDEDYLKALSRQFDGYSIIPEGGSHKNAIQGIANVVKEVEWDFDTILTPVASGATLAGVAQSLNTHQRAIGIAVLKGKGYLETLVESFVSPPRGNWHIEHGFHHGRYGKVSPELDRFCTDLFEEYKVPVEGVYSGKLFFALKAMLANRTFPKGHKILVLHTGGVQGARQKQPNNLKFT